MTCLFFLDPRRLLLRQSDPQDGFPTSEPEIIKDVGDEEEQIKRLVYAESSRFNRVRKTKVFFISRKKLTVQSSADLCSTS